MYEVLISHLRDCAKYDQYENTFAEAADAIEELNRYAAQMDKLREDGWYLLKETSGTYGPITMKMPIPEPLSCDDVLKIINAEPPKEEQGDV